MSIRERLQGLADACADADPSFDMMIVELPSGVFEALAAEPGDVAGRSDHGTMFDLEFPSGLVRVLGGLSEHTS